MSLGTYDNKMMEFIYFLTKNQKFMNSVEIAKEFKPSKGKISDRTIRRWFNRLQQGCFDYYPTIKYEAFAFRLTYVLLRNLRTDKILNIIPHINYLTCGFNFNDSDQCYLLSYLVPSNKKREFAEFWDMVRKLDIADEVLLFPLKTPTEFYSPFHKITKSNGELDFSKQDFDNTYFEEIFSRNFERKAEAVMESVVLENPLLIPTVFEYFREHWSSKKVWFNIKRKVGDKIWDYVPKVNKKTNGVGINLVQETMRDLHGKYYPTFFQQIRVFYEPLLSKAVDLYIFLEIKDWYGIKELLKSIAKLSLNLTVYPPVDKSKTMVLAALTNSKEFPNIVRIIREYDYSAKIDVLWRDIEKSSQYWNRDLLKMDFTLFNPKTFLWEYNHDYYMKTLDETIRKELPKRKVKPKVRVGK